MTLIMLATATIILILSIVVAVGYQVRVLSEFKETEYWKSILIITLYLWVIALLTPVGIFAISGVTLSTLVLSELMLSIFIGLTAFGTYLYKDHYHRQPSN